VPGAQGRGYATEAAAACRDLARGLGFRELIATIVPGNAPSIAVAERIGMTLEQIDVRPDGRTAAVHSMRL
jgi:RimJ/RimL family protein N-acetyltransferase